MFGYVIPNQGELKVRELEEYRAWYCGLCQRLQKDHGILGRISLNYDMTFLALLLSSLYEPDKTVSESNCLAHPLHRRRKYDTVYVGYAAAMNILLTYYKCVDDWKDDRNLLRGGYGLGLKRAGRRVSAEYPVKAETVRSCLEELSEAEEAGETNLDRVPGSLAGSAGRSLPWSRISGERICIIWAFILGSLFIFWMPGMIWRTMKRKAAIIRCYLIYRIKKCFGVSSRHRTSGRY